MSAKEYAGSRTPELAGALSQSRSARAGADAARSPAEDGSAPAGLPPLVIRGKSCRSSLDPSTGEEVFLVEDARGEWVQVSGRNAATPAYAAITDWLNFTFPFEGTEEALEAVLERFREVLGRKFQPAVKCRTGIHNYEHRYELGKDLKTFFCYGGKDQRGSALLSLSGIACALILDWPAVVALGRDELQGRVTRWDGAVDDYLGLHTIEDAIQLYLEGKFTTGGRPPIPQHHGNWLQPGTTGRTITIGKRENGKRFSVYEKGQQLGCAGHPWVRWELSYGHKGREIPWGVLLEPGKYVVGAYPKALSWVQEEMSRVRTLQKQTQISYDAAVEHARHQVGRTINLMVKVEGSVEKAFAKLRREGLPRRVRHPAVEDPEGWLE